MSSFAAILSADRPADPGVVKEMLSAAPHRGARHDALQLGRAAIGISDDVVASDAWLAIDDGFAAAVVGRVDNLDDLAVRHTGSSDGSSPADVVLQLFRSEGERAPRKMRGVYAVVVTDGAQLWLFRDHLAFAQVMYRHDRRGFFAASEAKQVLAGARVPRRPDVETIEGWFYGDVNDGETRAAVEGAMRPARATILRTDGSKAWVRRYWEPEARFETGDHAEDDLQDRFDHLMRQAVVRCLTGHDVVSLSGGIDSPAVVAYGAEEALRRSGRPLAALSYIFPDFPEVDERRYIDEVVRAFDLEAHAFQPTAGPLDDIREWVDLCDSPCPIHPPAEAAQYYRRAKDLGYTNVIGGELAEFLTSERAAVLSHLVSRGRWRTIPRVISSQRDIQISWVGIARQLVYAFIPLAVLRERERRRRLPPDAGFPAWLDEGRVAAANARNLVSPMSRYRWEQTGFFVGPPIGTESDATVQAVTGVMNRRPWVDVDLAEFFISIPAEIKFPDFRLKTFVRRLLRGRVPDVILDRTDKTYFNQRILGTIDWAGLERWLVRPSYRMPGVDYDMLADRIERRSFLIGDYKWATDLAKTHAFMSLWE